MIEKDPQRCPLAYLLYIHTRDTYQGIAGVVAHAYDPSSGGSGRRAGVGLRPRQVTESRKSSEACTMLAVAAHTCAFLRGPGVLRTGREPWRTIGLFRRGDGVLAHT